MATKLSKVKRKTRESRKSSLAFVRRLRQRQAHTKTPILRLTDAEKTLLRREKTPEPDTSPMACRLR